MRAVGHRRRVAARREIEGNEACFAWWPAFSSKNRRWPPFGASLGRFWRGPGGLTRSIFKIFG